MSNQAAIDKDALFSLYIGSEWSGPYHLDEIRGLVKKGEVAVDTYAYEPNQQRHFTVEELIAAPAETPSSSAKPASVQPGGGSSFGSSSAITLSVFDDVVDIAPAQTPVEFEQAIPELRDLYRAYLGLTERRSADPHQAAHDLRKALQAVSDVLASRQSDNGALHDLINQIDEVADYLANRHQIPQLWQLISEMEKVDLAVAPERGVETANAVLACIAERGERHQPAVGQSSGVLLDMDQEDEHDSVATRKILLSARHEVQNAKKDMEALQGAYAQLERQHQHDLEKAKKLLAKAEKSRAEDRHAAEQTVAELRALAAEIHRLAQEPDIAGGADAELMAEVASLGQELKTADPSTLAYIAEDVLIRMVERLRGLATAPEDVGALRDELTRVRGELVQARLQVEALTAERDQLQQQYQQQRIAAEHASARARDREHRLRSTVTALEVTKELHQEVMKDLQEQLRTAQGRVEAMEQDLASVRGEIKGARGGNEERDHELQGEMQRMVEMRAMLEVRREELSANLKSAEAELAKAQAGKAGDHELAEALAAKVNHLRQTFEATKLRLSEQEDVAKRLEDELAASRDEATELRGRSDQLSGELDEARSGLANAKKRVEELDAAYGRLEAERESLQNELASRKSTDTIRKDGKEAESGTERFVKLEDELAKVAKQAETADMQLAGERRKVLALAEAQVAAQARIEELTAERDELRRKLDFLQKTHFTDHARHTAAIAVSTQAAIESERRLKEAQAQLAILESQLAKHAPGQQEALEPTPPAGQAVAADEAGDLRARLAEAQAQALRSSQELAAAYAERDRLATVGAAGPDISAEVAERLVQVERELTAAITARDDVHAKLMQTVGERDRLRRELERLRNEHESAAVEHRTALKSARDRLVESQARTAELERQLAGRPAAGDQDPLAVQLATALAEQDRLRGDVKRHAEQIERLNAGQPSGRDAQLVELARASHQLATEQERVLVLTRSLVEALQAAEGARGRGLELQAKLAAQQAERDQYQLECDRLRSELAVARVQGLPDADQGALREAIAARDQALAGLERTTAELAELRQRLAGGERAAETAERLGEEQERIRALETQLDEARRGEQGAQQTFAEARARLVQVSGERDRLIAERDRLAAELAQLKGRPDYADELKTIKRRLLRAKRVIKKLRRERDAALAERDHSAATLQELSAQIERMRSANRAAAEALGATLPGHGEGGEPHTAGFSTRNLGVALQPLIRPPGGDESSAQHGVPRALTRRIMTAEQRPPGGGFTSAFGRPSIPGLPTAAAAFAGPGHESSTPMPAQTKITVREMGRPPTALSRRWHAGHWLRRPWVAGSTLVAVALGAGFALMPPLLPYSVQALVNARVVALTAPIEGQLSPLSHHVGENVERDQAVASIHNEHVDTGNLDALTAKREANAAKRAQLEQEVQDQGRAAKQLAEQLEARRVVLVEYLEQRLDAAVKRQELAKPTLPATGDDAAAVEIAGLRRQVEDARQGVFPVNEVPVEERKLDEARKALADAQRQLDELAGQATDLDRLVAAEQQRLAGLRLAELASPLAGPLWKQSALDGKWVKAGEEVLQIADPGTVQVEAVVSERYLEDIALGDAVQIWLSAEKRYIGGVVREPLRPLDEPTAAQVRSLRSTLPHRFKLLVSLDPTVARHLQIGQDAKLVVVGQSPGMVRRTLAWLYERTKF
jgi:chromosome segregation ATPase/multidrug resistance efflux pump